MEETNSAYNELLDLKRENLLFGLGMGSIVWDSLTALPPGGQNQRTEVMGIIGKILHKMESNPKFGTILDSVQKGPDYDSFDEVRKRNIHLIKKNYEETINLPEELFVRFIKQRNITRVKRAEALKKRDWKVLEPEFSNLFDCQVEIADCLMDVVGVSDPYDYHFNYWEEGMRADKISKIFADITKSVIPMVKKYAPQSETIRTDFLSRPVKKETQWKIVEELTEIVGYDTKSEKAVGTIGETQHPSSIGRYDDVRIALRFVEDDFLFSYRCTLHESGHGLYRINLNRNWMNQPVGMSAGFGIDESQAKFLEKVIGLSPEFLQYFLPKLNTITGDTFSDVTPIEFVRAANIVKPGPIRVKADELTFTLHIIIRFEIERDLFAGKINVSDVPAVWNDLYEKYLGIEVANDAEGVLQDVQLATCQFGHFPCHTLGNVFVAQLVEKMTEDLPEWKTQIGEGNVKDAIAWMTENVHRKGCLYDAPGLIEHVTGKKMSAKPFLNYLTIKYETLYK